MIEQMCYDFMKAELFPILDKIDSMSDPELMPTLMQKAGELGLLGLSVPEEYGGLGVDFKTSMLATEALGWSFFLCGLWCSYRYWNTTSTLLWQ